MNKFDEKTLYCLKFRSINKFLIESLVNPSIYFAKPDDLNDPFDCKMDVIKIIHNAASRQQDIAQRDFLMSFIHNNDFIENWKHVFSKIGVFSSSKVGEKSIYETLIWSHYGDEHKGVCISYQFPQDFIETIDLTAGGEVNYTDEPDCSNIYSDNLDHIKIIIQLIHITLKTKSLNWKYENEVRLIRKCSGVVSIKPEYIERIIFGLRTPPRDMDLIKKLCSTYCKCDNFYQMQADESFFKYKLVKLAN